MLVEIGESFRPKIPYSFEDQRNSLPNQETQQQIVDQLLMGITALLTSYGFSVDREKSLGRVKSIGRMQEKIVRRGSKTPLRDIYGIRVITDDARRAQMRELIQSAYPETPKVFSDGKPSFRDYSNPEVREYFRKNHNQHTSPLYSALHINIAFEREGSALLEIAEIQIMSHSELDIYNQTRAGYVTDQKNGHPTLGA